MDVGCPPVKKKLKALLLIPAASAGALTALAFSYPPQSAAELGLMLAIIAPLYLANFAALGWMWSKPVERVLGLRRGTWSVLVTVAYLLGLTLMLVA